MNAELVKLLASATQLRDGSGGAGRQGRRPEGRGNAPSAVDKDALQKALQGGQPRTLTDVQRKAAQVTAAPAQAASPSVTPVRKPRALSEERPSDPREEARQALLDRIAASEAKERQSEQQRQSGETAPSRGSGVPPHGEAKKEDQREERGVADERVAQAQSAPEQEAPFHHFLEADHT